CVPSFSPIFLPRDLLATIAPHPFPTRRSSDLQRLAHALGDATMDLPLDERVVEHPPAIVDRGIAAEAHDAGLRVDNCGRVLDHTDRKSTRLNSSHSQISYAVFCLKKKKCGTVQ